MLFALLFAASAPCPAFTHMGFAEDRSLTRALLFDMALSYDTGIAPNPHVTYQKPLRPPGEGFARTWFDIFKPGFYSVGVDAPGQIELYVGMKGAAPPVAPLSEETPGDCHGIYRLQRYWLPEGLYDLRASNLSVPRVTMMLLKDR